MLQSTIVTREDELEQIFTLNQQNLKQQLTNDEQKKEGFVTWLYSIDLLKKMHSLAPSIIIKDENKVVGYALTTLRESSVFHPDLQSMFHNLELLHFKGKPLFSYAFYCMGQICIAKEYRGKGLVQMLYQEHKEVYSPKYELLLTEISTSNKRSQQAHEKVGFRTIHTYRDALDEWNVVVWPWFKV
jgi:ribosomal protein S18 acetylase RimI-like enzyme